MLTHGALHRLAIDRPPVSRAFEFRSLTRAIIPTNCSLSLSELRKLRSFVEPLSGGEVSLSGSEVSPVVARLPISLTSPRARNEYSLFSSLR